MCHCNAAINLFLHLRLDEHIRLLQSAWALTGLEGVLRGQGGLLMLSLSSPW